jgi:hypothetical protein
MRNSVLEAPVTQYWRDSKIADVTTEMIAPNLVEAEG